MSRSQPSGSPAPSSPYPLLSQNKPSKQESKDLDERLAQKSDGTAVGKTNPVDKRKALLASKLDKLLLGLAEKVTGDGAKLNIPGLVMDNGKVTVQIWLSDSSDAALKKLEKAGVQVLFQSTTARMVIGKIAVGKLEDLALLEIVRLIEPVRELK